MMEIVYEKPDGEVVTEDYEEINIRGNGFVEVIVGEKETDETTLQKHYYIPRERVYRIERVLDMNAREGRSDRSGISSW